MKLRSQRDKTEKLRDPFEALESKNKTWIFLQKITHYNTQNRLLSKFNFLSWFPESKKKNRFI